LDTSLRPGEHKTALDFQSDEENAGSLNPTIVILREELQMNKDFLGTVANVVATIGVVVCAVSGLSRLLGSYHVLGYEALTLFIGGISLMVFSTLIKLHIIESHILGKR
jgi:type IV secretory pathway VirB2 component (pilin)